MGRGYIVGPNPQDLLDSIGAVATSIGLAERLIKEYKGGRTNSYPEPSYILHVPRGSDHRLLTGAEVGINGSGYLWVRPVIGQVSVGQVKVKKDKKPIVDLPRDLNQTHQIYHLSRPTVVLPLTKEMMDRALLNIHQLGNQFLRDNDTIIPISEPLEETLEICAREMGFR